MNYLFAALFISLLTPTVSAQSPNFPGRKPITFVVPFTAGGPTDRVARDLAEAMRKQVPGANFVVENTAGAGGTIAATKVANAAPDGHTLMVWHIGMAATPSLYPQLAYSPLEDFEYLGLINEVPMTLIGRPQLPVNTYGDFEKYIRANAGKLNLAHAGLGSASHICGMLWQATLQTREAMVTIPFGGTAPAMNALMGGQVDVLCDQTTNTTGPIESGRVKGFAVTTLKPLLNHPVLQYYPSLNEMGLKNFNFTVWHGLYAPKKTPAPVLQMLNEALKKALQDPEFIKRQEGLGAIIVNDKRTDPLEHKKFVATEIVKIKTAVESSKKYTN